MEEAFGKILERIFNNWFALKLAVDHSMGGPNSKQVGKVTIPTPNEIHLACFQTAIDCMNYMVQYCLYENDIDVYMIQKTLEDIMDEKFDTICEDESPKGNILFQINVLGQLSICFDTILEIATILFRFVQLMKDGNLQQCEEEFQKLPTMNDNWINTLSHAKQNVSYSYIGCLYCHFIF